MFISKLTAAIVFVLALGSVAFAESDHPYRDHVKDHPRVNQVNRKADKTVNKANQQAADGKITQQQNQKIDNQEAKIHNEENNMRAADGGHLTAADQAKLNHQENRVNKEDKNFVKQDAAGGNPPAAGN